MKCKFLLLFSFIPALIFSQPVIDFETVGNNWTWNIFSQGTGSGFDVVANPSKTGLNTSDSVALIDIGANGDPWAGAWCADFPDMQITANNCIVKILVYKNVRSRFNLKLEPPNVDHFDSNTVVNQWEELTFDYTSHIGTTGATLTLIPDQEWGTRTHASINYMDYIRFTAVVPVELSGFNAFVSDAGVLLTWTTASEINNAGFEIEKSTDNFTFEKIGFVKGAGTTTAACSYNFLDQNSSGKVYYRLKQIDHDGTFEYSNSVEADASSLLRYELAQNYPNPFNPSTKIKYSVAQNALVTLNVYDVLGNHISTLVNEEVEAGTYTVDFNAVGLASGVYYYTIKAGNFSDTKKLILMK
jgi:hypothetical protein